MPLETVKIHFNYDPEVLREAGVDLDSGTLTRIKDLLLAGLAKEGDPLTRTLCHEEGRLGAASSARLLSLSHMRRQLALIQALLAQG
jgi:hypothetical protein